MALARELLRRRQHRRMLERRGQDARRTPGGAERPGRAEQREVVGLGPARREGHLERLGPEGAGDGPARLLDDGAGALPGAVDARGVALQEGIRQRRDDGLARPGVEGRGRVVVEVAHPGRL
jgi:hypothetical protein